MQDNAAMDSSQHAAGPQGPAGGVDVAALRRRCDPASLPFVTTAELQDLDAAPGQQRALDAIHFGIGMQRDGYNLFAMGPEGIGRHTVVMRCLEGQAYELETPFDWCYVFNFEVPHQPRALRFPPGKARAFKSGMERLVGDLRVAIPAAFETDEYRNRRKEIEAELAGRQEAAIGALGERARPQGVALVHTPNGFGFVPVGNDKAMSPEEFRALPEDEQKRLEDVIRGFQEEMTLLLQDMPKWQREALRKLQALDREVMATAIDSLIDDLTAEYRGLPQVLDYLVRVREDMLEHGQAFRQPKDDEAADAGGTTPPTPEAERAVISLRRYAVNVLIANHPGDGAPVVYEDNPTHDALMGRIEHVSQLGALITDFTLIKPGALHHANGGYLVLDAAKLVGQPYAYDALKRALRAREIRTQSLGQTLGVVSTAAVEPEPIPLQVKVALVGSRELYYHLHASDPEFGMLFKVVADFEDDVPRDAGSQLEFARLIATAARREKLRALDAGAVAAMIEQQARATGDAEKISANMQNLIDLLREADFFAGSQGDELIGARHVKRAIEAQIERNDRVRKRLLEDMLRGGRLIATAGARVGQINGLSVLQLGDYAFGSVNRITARVRLGAGRVVDIERESDLGGRLHSKGVLILSGYLAGRYAADKPLSLAASLVMEQSYGGVEGDSASSAELYALLSALAEAPVQQRFAVTGSVNQHGDVQAIGGVNQKIEGFFDLCRARGLSGEQAVIIPHANVRNLMLREDVVEAVAQGRFAVYAVRSVDEGIALLTGLRADAVHARVEARLQEFAEQARSFGIGTPAPGRSHGEQQDR